MGTLQKTAVLAVWSFAVSLANAVVIDDFSDGLLTAGPSETNLRTTQTGLDPATVVGGSRELSALYGGSWEIGAGELRIEHDRGFFEVVGLRYGVVTDADATPLNLDATAGGAEQLLIRFGEVTPLGDAAASADLSLSFFSREGDEARSGGIGIGLPESTNPFTVAFDLDELQSFNGFTPTDIDGVNASLFLSGTMRIVIDSISFGTLAPGDLDGDGQVSEADLDAYGRFFGSNDPVAADANRDGVVNTADYTVWRDALSSGSATVPEPAAFGTLLLVLAGARLMRSDPLR